MTLSDQERTLVVAALCEYSAQLRRRIEGEHPAHVVETVTAVADDAVALAERFAARER